MDQIRWRRITDAPVVPAYRPHHVVQAISAFDDTRIAKEFVSADSWFQYNAVIEQRLPFVAVFAVGIMEPIAIAFEVTKQVNTIALRRKLIYKKKERKIYKKFFHDLIVVF